MFGIDFTSSCLIDMLPSREGKKRVKLIPLKHIRGISSLQFEIELDAIS